MTNDTIAEQLSAYGYAMTTEGEIVSPSGRASGVHVAVRKGRIVCTSAAGAKLFSGSDVGTFLERFWFAKKV